jgi:DNA-binding SARP family transcriptional activator
MQFRILGPLAAENDGGEVALGGARQRTLLALLLLRRGQVVPSERLIADLYGSEPPRAAATALRVHLSRLRRALGPTAPLLARAGGYVLELEPGALDAERFEQLLERGRGQLAGEAFEDAAATLREALGLWRGPALADVAYEDFAQSEIARLEELRLVALEERIEADLGAGRHSEVVGELEQLVREHPLRERLRAQSMLALYRSHRQAEALEAYQGGRRLLAGELGLEPGRPLRELEQAILRQDPALEPPSTSPAGTTPAKAAVFVGRHRELEQLRTCLEEALAGRGRLALVAGEPGIGKSRLAEELVGLARRRGATVLVGRCWEAGGAPAYWPWVQSLRTYLRHGNPAAMREQLGAGASELAQLFPELRELYPGLPEPPAPESDGARFRLFDAMATFLRNATAAQPLVLVLDDLHAADAPSLLLLRFLARDLGQARLLVVGAYRDVDPSLRDPLLATLAELGREPVTTRLVLDGLAQDDVARYIALEAGLEPGQAAVAEIHAETNGNPLFVGEIVRLLAGEGGLERAAGALRIPSGVREVIGSRIRRLSEPCQGALVLASVLGREFTVDTLERLSGMSREPLLDVLDEALAERVIGEVPGAAGELRFAHVLIRDTLHDGLSAPRRMQLHRAAGEALEDVYAGDLEPHLAEIALHFVESAPTGTADRAIDYARRAGDRALSLLAFEEAARLYELALTLIAGDAERCDLLLALGEARARAGAAVAAKQAFREAAELAEAGGSAEQLAHAALGYGGRVAWNVSRDDPTLAPLLERALEAIGEQDSVLRVQLLSRLSGGPLRDASYPAERKLALSKEALAMARRIGDPQALMYALAGYIPAHDSPVRTPELLGLASELIELAAELGDPERMAEGYEHRATCLLELGDMAAAKVDVAAMVDLAERLRQPAQTWIAVELRAQHALLEGDLAEAERLIEAQMAIGEQPPSWNAEVSFRLQTFLLHALRGTLQDVEGLVRRSAADYPTYSLFQCALPYTLAVIGEHAAARQALAALAADGFGWLPLDENWLVSVGLLAETTAILDDRAGAEALYPQLLPYAGRVAGSYSEISTGSAARYLGILAATTGRWEDAEAHFETALEANERIGARPWLALTRRDYAAMLRARGDPGDDRRANVLARAANELADAVGMSLFSSSDEGRKPGPTRDHASPDDTVDSPAQP